jgi:hypothetical protein
LISVCFFHGATCWLIDNHHTGSRWDTLRIRGRSGITFLDDTVGIILNWVVLNWLIALRGSVWFGLACGLVLREAGKCRTEQKSCKSELGSLSVKPHGLFPPAAIMLGGANSAQCIAGKFTINFGSTKRQMLWIEWLVAG